MISFQINPLHCLKNPCLAYTIPLKKINHRKTSVTEQRSLSLLVSCHPTNVYVRNEISRELAGSKSQCCSNSNSRVFWFFVRSVRKNSDQIPRPVIPKSYPEITTSCHLMKIKLMSWMKLFVPSLTHAALLCLIRHLYCLLFAIPTSSALHQRLFTSLTIFPLYPLQISKTNIPIDCYSPFINFQFKLITIF